MYNYYNFQYYNLWYSIKCYTCEVFNTIFYFMFNKIYKSNINYNKNDIIFFCSYGYIPGNIKWDGKSLSTGIGGAEYCIIKLAEEMAKDNNIYNRKIVVYCDCIENTVINNVHYMKSKFFDYSIKYNTIIIWRIPFVEYFLHYNKLILWIHDGGIIPALDVFYRINILKYFINPNINIVVPSQFIYNEFIKYKYNNNNIYTNLYKLNHGFEKYNGEIISEHTPNTFIWHVNLSRGLLTFLNHFHLILKEFPNSKIYICGDRVAYNKNNMIDNMIDKYKKNIIYTNKLNHEKVLELLSKCDFFCYTGNIIESFSLCTWEAAINGCIPIVYDIGALSEINDVGGIVIENTNSHSVISNVLNLMRNQSQKEYIRERIIENIIKTKIYKWFDIKNKWYKLFT